MRNPFLLLSFAALSAFSARIETPLAEKCQEKAEIRWTRTICVEEGRYIGWPTVCRLRNGDILAVFSGDREEHVCPCGKVQMVRSSDDGETWSKPVTIADGPIDDRDAGIVQMLDGEIVVTYFTSVAYYQRGLYKDGWKDSNMEELGYFRTSSRDDGKTWSKPERMLGGVSQAPHGPKLMKDGSLIVMGRSFRGAKVGEDTKNHTVISVWKSVDAGRNWTCLCPSVPDMDGENAKPDMFHEPDIVELPDGTLLGQVRYHGGDHGLRQTVSKDGGRTWSPMRKTELVGYPSHLLVLSDGRLLSVYSRRLASAGLGEFAAISSDGGRTWDVKNEICLLPGVKPTRDFGYPASCELPNGDILTVYYQPKAVGEKPCLMATKWRPRDFAKTGKVRISDYREKYWTSVRTEPDVPRLPAKADAAFRGRVADLVRICPENAVGPETREWKGFAWRNERVHAQFVVWSGEEVLDLRVLKEALRSENGGVIPAEAISARFVLNVLGEPASPSVESGFRLYGDLLDGEVRPKLPPNAFRAVWLTLTPPKGIPAGTYRGGVTVRGNGGKEIRFSLSLEVADRTLPDPADWKAFVTIHAHPLTVAKLHRVAPFSKEHYGLLLPLLRELAAAGQKVVHVNLFNPPWIKDGQYRNFILVTRRADGTFAYDYSVFDEYVGFAKRAGIVGGIYCPGLGWRKNNHVDYVDERSGDLVREDFAIGSPESERFWGPFAAAFQRHLKEKGWLEGASMRLDELKYEDAVASIELARKYAPDLAVSVASDKPPEKFLKLGIRNFSQGLRAPDHYFFPESFLKAVEERAKDPNLITSYYICNLPGTPNTWLRSTYDECQWQGLFSAAKRFSGVNRWTAFCWWRDPEWDGSCPPRYDAGERFLLYPRARASTRWEMLRDSIENYEKIRILRETGGMTDELEAALAAMTPECVDQYASEEAFKVGWERASRQVRPVLKALESASRVRRAGEMK